MKLPVQIVPGSVPPRFEYYAIVNLPGGGTQAVKQVSSVSASMEVALCDLIRIAKQLAAENAALRKK